MIQHTTPWPHDHKASAPGELEFGRDLHPRFIDCAIMVINSGVLARCPFYSTLDKKCEGAFEDLEAVCRRMVNSC